MKQYRELELIALKYIEDNIRFLDNNDFEAFYGNMDDVPDIVKSRISSMLLQSEINPLLYLESIPEGFLKYADRFEDFHLTDFVIPDNIREIGINSFYKAGLTGSLTLPAALEDISSNAFGNNYIKSLDLSRCKHSLNFPMSSFIYNSFLEYILLPAPDIAITFREGSFEQCSKLKQLIYPGTKAQFHENIILEERWILQTIGSKDHIIVNCTDGEFYIRL